MISRCRRAIAIAAAAAAVFATIVAAQAPQPSSAPPPILLSRQLVARAHVSVGDVVRIATDPNGASARTFRVAGVYEPTPDPMRFTAERLEVRFHLPDLVALTADPHDAGTADFVNAINVRLATPAEAVRFTSELNARVPGLAIHSIARRPENDPFAVLDRFHLAISLVTVSAATAFLLALMVIRAEERRETVGALRLLGVSRRTLLLEVAVEGLLIALAGAVFGALIAFAAQGIVNGVFQRRYDTTLVFVRVTGPIALRSIALAVPLGIAAGVGASWTLIRRDILSLVRR